VPDRNQKAVVVTAIISSYYP